MSNLVTYTQAQRLKKLGFDEETHQEYRTPVVRVFEGGKAKYVEREPDVYDTGKHVSFYGDVSYDNCTPAPTVSEALDFIREKGIACAVGLYYSNYKKAITYVGSIIEKDTALSTNYFDTHPLAESALLNVVLDYLESSKEKSFSES